MRDSYLVSFHFLRILAQMYIQMYMLFEDISSIRQINVLNVLFLALTWKR